MDEDYERQLARRDGLIEGDVAWLMLEQLERMNLTLDMILDRVETQTDLLAAIRREVRA